MTALGTDRPMVRALGEHTAYPVKATTKIYEGAMVGLTSGLARGATTADVFAGHAIRTADNTGGNSAINVDVLTGRYCLMVTVPDVAVTSVGAAVYATDDATLALTGTLRVGTVQRYVTTNTAVVEFDTAPLTVTPSDASVSTAKVADGAVTPVKQSSTTATTVTTGPVLVQTITAAGFKALCDGTENELFAVKAGDIILNVALNVKTAHGSAATVTIGTDADVDGTTKDVDALLKAGDLNAVGHQNAMDPAKTYVGADLEGGPFTVDDDGFITVTSGGDYSAGAIVATATLTYIPAVAAA